MSKIILDDDSTNLDPLVINENFRKIEKEFNEKVLYRDTPEGEPNEMENDLDMNGNRIYNLPKPVEGHEPARLADLGFLPEEIKEYAEESKEWAEKSQDAYEHTLEALAAGSVYIGDYGPGLVIEEYTNFFGRDGIWWRPSPDLVLPYTTTGDWGAEEGLFVAVGDQALRQDLADSNDPDKGAGMVGYRGRTVHETLDDFYNIKSLGAQGDGVTDNSSVLQNAIDSGLSSLFIPEGIFNIRHIELRDNLTFYGPGKIYVMDPTQVGILGSGVKNVSFGGINIEGAGEPGEHLVRLVNSENVSFVSCSLTKSGRFGISLESCEKIDVINSRFINNYYYGIQDKSGKNNRFLGNYYENNGDTGTHQSTSSTGSPAGRGLVLWGCEGTTVSNETYISNTEYGLRLYSETASALVNQGINISNLNFKDNGKRDFAISNTDNVNQKIRDCIIKGIVIERTAIDSEYYLDVLSVQGKNILVDGVNLINNTGLKIDLLSVYNANSCVIKNVKANNTTFITLGSAVSMTFDTVVLDGSDRLLQQLYSDYVVRNCTAIANAGAEFALAMVSAGLVGIVLDSNVLDGFNIPITTNQDAQFSMIDNITKNSGTYGWELGVGNSHVNCVIRGNRFDKVRFPYHNGWESKGYRNVVHYNAPIPRGSWIRGDIIWNTAPTGGSPIGWMCTSGGESPSWVQMPSL